MAQTTTNTYDRANRLKSEVRVADQYSPAGSGYSQSYSYDKAGNRTSVTRNGNSYGYSYGLWNRLSTAEGYTLSNYDGDGNPLTVIVPGQGTWSCLYDEEGRITTQTGPKGITYSYDADGRRVAMTVSGLTTKYVYDGSTMIMEVGPSYDSYHLPGVTFVANGTQYLDRYDQLGSSLATVSQISALQSAREYDAYGREFEYKTGPRSVYRFAGKHGYVSDWDTKMLLLGARYYIPHLGRFLTQDPIGQAGRLNLYNYCDNNPLAKVDPDGKAFIEVRARRVFGSPFHHAYIKMTDNVKGSKTYGWSWTFSAGPQFSGAYAGDLTSYSGFLHGRKGSKGASYEYSAESISIAHLVNDSSPIGLFLNAAIDAENSFMAWSVAYNPTGTNSNSFARELIERMGLLPELNRASGWARRPLLPGWSNDPWGSADFSSALPRDRRTLWNR